MTTDKLHESPESQSEAGKDMHRAVNSLTEELEAVDWYQQRAEATNDPELRTLLEHNRNEEIEHAMMLLAWMRRHDRVVDSNVKRFLGAPDASSEPKPAPTEHAHPNANRAKPLSSSDLEHQLDGE